ncbi:V-type ATP synthase subunit E family protein [Alkalibacterium sp. 20]|uniref:V-type ATP synthase subunit E family protein n=1 Tax=Alkalibacterium sp. 20 TaxID=1798803 RepID=UPI0009002A20|nr:V-type ATP synthase subunit E family protein [Alkalibacterium sp. 20]OJF89743.1 hypothetical protein AX762_04975 [Alkalibacterium sp. 20]
MADLKLLTERVVEKERAALRQKVEQAKIAAAEDVLASQTAEVAKRQQLKDDVKEKVEKEYVIKTNTLEIKKRNNILSAKQNLLNKIFVDTKDKLDTLDKSTFQTFVLNVFQNFENEKEITLIFGEKSRDLIDTVWIKENAPENLSVRISDETISKKSGLIVGKDDIDYNFVFDILVEELKSDILSEISNELF